MGNQNSSNEDYGIDYGTEAINPHYSNATSIYEFTVKNYNGEGVKLNKFNGKVTIIVNLDIEDDEANIHCSEFQTLLRTYNDLHVLAFPCLTFSRHQRNNSGLFLHLFHSTLKFNRFHLFQAVHVNGPQAHPLWKFLKHHQPGLLISEIKGAFTKFVINKYGMPVAREWMLVRPLELIPILETCCNERTRSEEFVFVETSGPSRNSYKTKESSGSTSHNSPHHEQHSNKANTSQIAAKKNQKDDVDCPTCYNRYGVKIYQCSQGHSSCEACWRTKAVCGICRKPIIDIRNIALEAYISELSVPCANKNIGCCLHFKLGEMEKHLKECLFQDMLCPLYGTNECHFEGKIAELADHFDRIHLENRLAKLNNEMVLSELHEEFKTLYLININNHNFLIHLKTSGLQKKIYMAVQLLNTDVSASKWNYEWEVYNKREPRRKYYYTSVCIGRGTHIDEIFNESTCAVLPLKYAKTFINQGCLNHKISITKH